MICLGNVFVLGDSYSTFEGCIPEGYNTWYYKKIQNPTDVDDVRQTWWKQLLESTDSNLVRNSSFSGTTICNTGYHGDCSDTSFIGRFDKLVQAGYFEENPVDTLFVFGGTNDSWADAPLGELLYADWSKEALFSVLPAVCYLMHRLKSTLPQTRILFVINTGLKPEIANGIKTACAMFGLENIELKDIAKQDGHPNQEGMTQIKEQILAYLDSHRD